MANIGKNIKMFRVRKNMTQEAFAEKLFVSRQTVSNYENNKSNPDIEMLVKIAEVLETDVNTLIYGEPELIQKKKKILKAMMKVIGIILLGIAVFYLKEKIIRKELISNYDVTGMYLFHATIEPAFWIITGWMLMEIIFSFFQVQPIKQTIGKWMFWITAIFLAGYVILILPSCIDMVVDQIRYAIAYRQWELSGTSSFSWSHEMNFIPWWDSWAAWTVIYVVAKYALLFILPGILLRISRHKK